VPAGPRAAPLRAGYPRPAGPSAAQRQLRHAAEAVRSASSCAVHYRGVGCARGVWSLAERGGLSRLRMVSVSVVPLAVASWGVVRLGERRLRAYRCSRGRRPSGSDSEAKDPLPTFSSTTPERGRRSVDSDSATTRLPTFKSHAHSLVVRASRGSSPSVICHRDQCPIPRLRTCLTVGWQSRFRTGSNAAGSASE
jgi:hypothetical protein